MWEILDTGSKSPDENMRLDEQLLETVKQPTLHLYEWSSDSATYGYFTNPAKFLNLPKAKELGLNLARRPTGGGIIFHLWDLAFSVIVPAHSPEFSLNTLQNYAFVNHAVLAAIREFLNEYPPLTLISDDFSPWDPDCSSFCMAKPTKYDVMWEGKKVAGAAQRKTKAGFLHQGSIALVMPPADYLAQILLPNTRVPEAMQTFTCPLLGKTATQAHMLSAKQQLKAHLATHLTAASLTLSTYE